MGKSAGNPKVRRILMQAALVLVFGLTLGVAALVARHARMSMRAELAEPRTFGRLIVRLPQKWQSSPAAVERGDGVDANEPPDEQQPGRRLHIMRERSDGLIAPLEHLLRSRGGQVKADVLKAIAEKREGFSVTNLTVAGWPGQMITMVASPRAGVVHKDVIACAVLPNSQAVVVQLQGMGPLDASDQELVRQMSENVSLASQAAAAPAAAGTLDLVDDVKVDAPPRFLLVPGDDPNVLQRQLLMDGAAAAAAGGGWVAIDLVSCVFFADDNKDDALAALLAARDPDWRCGPVMRLGPRTLYADRVEAPGQPSFASRAYLTGGVDGRALLVVMRGGPRDARHFDAAWQSMGGTVRFAGTKDLSALLANGAAAARGVAVGPDADWAGGGGSQSWFMWDAAENADREPWAQSTWQVSKKADDTPPPAGGPATVAPAAPAAAAAAAGVNATVIGTRTSRPADPYANDVQFEQQWTASADLSRYEVTTYRQTPRGGNQYPRQSREQRVTLDRGRLTVAAPAANGGAAPPVTMPAPEQFVPGAVLPLVLRDLADKPALIKTESFVGTDTLTPPGLITLFVTRLTDAPVRLDDAGEPMDCVSVSVNGSGQVSRWYYAADHTLQFIDFAGGLKAQGEAGK